MSTCSKILPLSEVITDCDAYSLEYRVTYIGRLTAVEYQNGFLRAMFGRSYIVAKMDALPEWITEGCDVEVEIRHDGTKISPLMYNFSQYEKDKIDSGDDLHS